ncbi:hypothetical protein [Litoribaculum gwangyangense]|uniref:DUF4412 domain-containing protein n=1 Tax=Litoribaculum gwangyangense TaxID=1130722 RepID=A0ABP9CII8_9FLAO
MKLKSLLIPVLSLSIISTAEAQLLKKLKQKAEQAAERTILNKTDEIVAQKTEKTIDDVVDGDDGDSNESVSSKDSETSKSNAKFANPALENNTAAKRAWYTTDVRVTSYDKEKQSDMVCYFDADAIAMRSHFKDQNTGKPKTSYTDSDGYFISFNESENQYTKTALLAMPGMSMMAPSMMASAYKLPTGAVFGAFEEMDKQGLAVYPFMHVDFPFVLKPEHFRDEMNSSAYRESKQSCRGSLGCTKFSVLEAGYEGSYTLFDNQNRLVEINIYIKDDPFFGSGKGKIEYFYEDVEVKVPAAVEKKMPGQDLFKKGLDPKN